MLFVAVIHTVLVRFGQDQGVLRDLVHPEKDLGDDGVKVDPLAYIRREVWGMRYVQALCLRRPKAL